MRRNQTNRIIIILLVLLSGIFLSSSRAADAVQKQMVLPHIPSERTYWQCLLVSDNLSASAATFRLTLFDAAGEQVLDRAYDVPAFGYQEVDLLNPAYPESASGLIALDAEREMSFRVVYRNRVDGGVAEFRLTDNAAPFLAFNFGTYNDSLTWKGLAVTATGSEDTEVWFTAYDGDGRKLGSFSRQLAGQSRTSFVLQDDQAFGASFPWESCVRVYATSPVGLAGLNISGVNNDKLMFTLAQGVSVLPDDAQVGGFTDTGYRVIAWNDLGMHCYDDDYSMFSILPPYNTIWAQVIRMGETPEIVTSGVTVSYRFENNTTSVGKTNFWEHVSDLFGISLSPDTGLTGNGLSGDMASDGDHFIAEGIPLTQFNDDQSVNYYQTAIVTARDVAGNILAQTRTVAPVSNEMHCANCHGDGRIDGISTGHFRTNILELHDREEGTSLMSSQPVLCASCHTSNALGTVGTQDHLSRVMHGTHASVIPDNLDGCYNCHPGPDTACLRGVMFQEGITCTGCHGSMEQVASDMRQPWLDEPNCGDCHAYGTPDGALYRMSTGHGGVYCEACHGSPHAILPSALAADNEQSLLLQGSEGPLAKCSVCHTDGRTGDNPHEAFHHPAGWYGDHGDYVEDHGYASCSECHGADYRGGWSGVSCYQCHDGPSGDDD